MFTSKATCSLVLLFVFASFLVEVSAKCEMTQQDLENCGIKGGLFDNADKNIPLTEEELTEFCDDSRKSFECIGRYVETCTSGGAKVILDAIQARAVEDFKDRCVDPAGRKAFLENIICAKNVANRDHINHCLHGFVGQLNLKNLLHSTMTKEERWHLFCCGLAQLHECLYTRVKNACPKNLNYWRNKIIFTEHMENTCDQFVTVEYCDANASAQFWPKLKRVFISPESEGVEIKWKSPATGIISFISAGN